MRISDWSSDVCSSDLPAMVVTRHDQHTAIGMSPCEIAMLERVAGTINPRSLAVPDGTYAILISLRYGRKHLGAPPRRRSQVLVHAGLEPDLMAFHTFMVAPQLPLVRPARRNAHN